MNEKVYTIPSIWDMTIVEGVADYKGVPHHFYCLNPDKGEDGFFSDRYKLIPLTSVIFELEMLSWSNWLHWLDMYRKGCRIPHSNEYEKERKIKPYDQVFFDNKNFTQEEKERAEQNFQWQLEIDKYLGITAPLSYQVKGIFSGSTDFSSKTEDLFVEWIDLKNRYIE
ncbi:MAG: hypothetical protein E6767_11250 [Dysgonomonas sp.]|nr:hypothetical protein [Dysgonomonas sp.]